MIACVVHIKNVRNNGLNYIMSCFLSNMLRKILFVTTQIHPEHNSEYGHTNYLTREKIK